MNPSRRDAFKMLLLGAAAAPLSLTRAAASTPARNGAGGPTWQTGVEQQRKADLGNGSYLNPIVAGDHPDPTILKDGDDYYMTFTPFSSTPGLVIWHSRDLVNWQPIATALNKPLGTTFAVDLSKHQGRYFIYIPASIGEQGWSLFVIWADHIEGPWSEPIDLKVGGCIDPCHIVGEDGKRYLFVNGVRRVRLSDDGLAADGLLEAAYSPWHYPDDWVVEDFAPEGPKLLRHGDWFYLVTAVGGTAGPPTSHMVIAARSKSIHGPWEHCPNNPLVRTASAEEPWWSRGHATLVEGPAGDWWMVYHGYENGFRTLGRQTLLEPIEWTSDGWFKAKGGDLSRPLAKPRGRYTSPHGLALSDGFTAKSLGLQWSIPDAKPDELQRLQPGPQGMGFAAGGQSPADSAPLTCLPGDRSYVAELALEVSGNAEGGLLLFYNPKAFVGIGVTSRELKTFEYADELAWMRKPIPAGRIRLRLTNDQHIVTFHYSHDDGQTWLRHDLRMEVSGMHHNVFGGFLSLRIGIYSAGEGSIVMRDFRYRAIEPA